MKLKITGRSPEIFNETLIGVLNIACVVAGWGRIPTDHDIETASGRYWQRETDNARFQLLPIGNDYWANIREEGESYIVIEFSYRYDRTGICVALSNLILLRFPENVTIDE